MPEDRTSAISGDQIKAALRRSGYLLESRLDTLLRRRGFCVQTNVGYLDPATGKARELDLRALRAFRAGPRETDFVWSLCLIECVNSPQPIAFFTKPAPPPFMRSELIQVAGMPILFLSSANKSTPVTEAIAIQEYHHYCRGRVATQFCSFSEKRGNPPEWFAQHVPEHFSCFSKLLDTVRDSACELADCWFDAGGARHENLNLEFFYPVLVVAGAPLYDVVQRRGSVDIRQKNHFLYRASGVANQQLVEYLVDVVTEAAFPRFMSMIDREMKTTAERVRRRSKIVRRSLLRFYCGMPISRRRLEAVPWASLCIRCQEEADRDDAKAFKSAEASLVDAA